MIRTLPAPEWRRTDGTPAPAGSWARVARDAYAAVAILWIVLVLVGYFMPNDAHLWWQYGRLPNPYAVTDYAAGIGFYYSPPVAFALAPFTLLPFPVFGAAMTALAFASLWYLAGRWSLLALLFPPVFWELWAANLSFVFAAIAVAGLRRPALWSVALLTKVTPGIGLGWFVVRREWRNLAVALGVTAAICAPTLLWPSLWTSWVSSLVGNAGFGTHYFAVDMPLLPRLAAAAALVVLAARTERRWLMPVAVTIAVPVIWFNTLAGLVGALRRR